MKPLYTLLLILGIIATMWTAAAVKMATPPENDNPPLFSTELTERIRAGMTIEDVSTLLRTEPCNKISDKQGFLIYSWSDSMGQSVTAKTTCGLVLELNPYSGKSMNAGNRG